MGGSCQPIAICEFLAAAVRVWLLALALLLGAAAFWLAGGGLWERGD